MAETRNLTHVRIVKRRAGRRISDSRGESRTRCGGEMSAYDVLPEDAKHATCPRCNPRTDQTAQGEVDVEKAVASALEIVAECVNCPYGKIWLPAWQVDGHRAAGHDVRRVEGKA